MQTNIFKDLKHGYLFQGCPANYEGIAAAQRKVNQISEGFLLSTDAIVFSFIFLHNKPIYGIGSSANAKNKSNKIIILVSNAINNISLITHILRK